jgi:hypothetical protein
MSREIEIPILPHLKKFINKFYQFNGEPFEVTLDNPIGIAMKHVLKDRKKVDLKLVERCTTTARFQLASDFTKYELRMSFICQFNREFDRIFKNMMYLWIMAQFEVGINNRVAVKNFLRQFEISDNEYSYESAYRAWSRYKKDEYRRIKNKRGVLS